MPAAVVAVELVTYRLYAPNPQMNGAFMSLRSRYPLSLLLLASIAMPAAAAPSYLVVTPSPGKQALNVPAPEPITVALSAATLPQAKVRKAYTYDFKPNLSVLGDPNFKIQDVSFTVQSGLPPGLRLTAEGLLEGAPTELTQGQTLEVQANYKNEVGSQVYTIVIGQTKLQAVKVAIGTTHGCAITPESALLCWGWNAVGQLGVGYANVGAHPEPVPVQGMQSGVTDVAIGLAGTCAVRSGQVLCWGSRAVETAPMGNIVSSPLLISGISSGATKVSVGAASACAIAGGQAYCWGSNSDRQLGNGGSASSTSAQSVVDQVGTITDIAVGGRHACMIDGGAVKCFGSNLQGQRGVEDNIMADRPVTIPGMTSEVTKVAAGPASTCVIRFDMLYCFGENRSGQLTGAPTDDVRQPSVIAIGAKAVSFGTEHMCVIVNGATYCLGRRAYGNLGDGTTDVAQTGGSFVQVQGLTAAADLALGGFSTCAIDQGLAKCWGYGGMGQLGNGAMESRGVADFVAEPGS